MLSLVKKVTTVSGRRNPMQSRLMIHGPAAPEGSLEAKVRHYLPKDYHIVLATLGAYATIIMLFKLKPSKKKAEEIVATPSSSNSNSTLTSIPSLFDDEFDEWSKLPGNMDKWEKSLETLGN